jgi:hypothetical protein
MKRSTAKWVVAGRRKRRDMVLAYLQDHPCVRCGFSDPRALDFHHRNPLDKTASIGLMVNQNANMGRILEEITKCDILCANCHRIHHAEERGELP